jgi:hypothetical protein
VGSLALAGHPAPVARLGRAIAMSRVELGSFRVIEQSRLEGAVIHVEAGRQLFVTRIDTAVFEAYFGRPRVGDDPKRRLTKRECNLLATANLELLAPLIQAKVDAGDYGKIEPDPHPFVELALGDLRQSAARLSDRILDIADRSGWAGIEGRAEPTDE